MGVQLYVRVYVGICTLVHVYTCLALCSYVLDVCAYVCRCMCLSDWLYVYMWVDVCAYVRGCTSLGICSYVNGCMCLYVWVYVHMCVDVCRYMFGCMCYMYVDVPPWVYVHMPVDAYACMFGCMCKCA